jgi:uncharacterized protein
LPAQGIARRADFVKEMKVSYHVIEADNLSIEGFTDNPANRCYLCKTGSVCRIKKFAEENNYEWIGRWFNIDDLGDDRPGMKALQELGVISPLWRRI